MSCCQCAPPPPLPATSNEGTLLWFRAGFLILSGGLAMYLSLAINISPATGLSRTVIHAILALAAGLALVFAGAPIFRKSFVPRVTLEQLFLIGLCGSYAASLYSSVTGIGHIYYEVVIILLAIYHFGQIITRSQLRRMESLENEIPGLRGTARVVGESAAIPITSVRTGQLIEVRPGEIVPADAIVENGNAFIENLIHTGEPFPATVGKGEPVLAGCRVLDGTLILKATAPGTDRELDRLLAACQSNTALPSESLAASILRFFVPAVIVVASLTVIAWIGIGDTPRALFNGLAVTIVACPCGIGLAIPLALRRSHARLRLLGFVPHVPDFLERLASAHTIAFDKTGTLTSPALSVKSIDTVPQAPPALLPWLATIQRQSTHPVARPFWNIAEPASLENLHITPIPGRGIRARFSADGHPHDLTICNSLHLTSTPAASHDRTLHLILDSIPIAHITFAESSRDGAIRTLENLKNAGYPLELLTGDSAVPASLQEIIPCQTGLTAAEKAEHIRAHTLSGHRTLLIGDGLNDTEAMSAAHLSIALGPEAKAASAVASATLSHHDLTAIPQALSIAKSTRRTLTRLLAFTLTYNFIGIALAASGLLHPVSAAILMLASSATVLFMANRDNNHKTPSPPAQG